MKSLASYELRAAGIVENSLFTTRYGVEYMIGLADCSNWFGLPSVRFKNAAMLFELDQNSKDVRAPFDARIKATVAAFILDYLKRHPDDFLFYVHSDADGKAHQRKLAFDRWFTSSQQNHDFVLKSFQLIEDQEIHFLYRKDRPAIVNLLDDVEIYSTLPKYLINS